MPASPGFYEFRWLWVGHTVPNGNPPEPFCKSTRLCAAVIVPPISVPDGFRTLEVRPDKTVHFWAVIPICQEEMRFKLRSGLDSLLSRFDRAGVTELLDVSRTNSCARRFWIFGR